MEQPHETRPLSDEERNYLLTIYNTRLSFFLPTFISLLGLTTFCSVRYSVSREKDALEPMYQAMINFCFIGLPVVLIGIRIFNKRIFAYRADAKKGFKEMVPYAILEKEYFPLTGKYYFRIDDPDNMHFEVDADEFSRYNTGDIFHVPRAPRSKFTFEYNGRFEIV
jgi:hypothetical protein